MRFTRWIGLFSVVLVMVLSQAQPAHAWTRTVVHSARATVEVEPDATLYVLLRLDVEVHAGWLHEIELVDLGPDVELDRYRPPYFRSDEGEIFRPEAELHEDGRIRLSFARREAPRHGEYKVYIRYRAPAEVSAVQVAGEKHPRVVWSVPAWETGLHDVSVEFRAPKGTRVPDEMKDNSPGVQLEISEGPRRTIVRWRRIHLPRLTAWPLGLDLPEGSIALPAEQPLAPRPDGFRPLSTPQKRPVAWALLAISILALLKRRSLESRLGRQKLWIPAPWPLVVAATGALVATAQLVDPTGLSWGLPLVLLAMHRPCREPAHPEGRSWAAARPEMGPRELELRLLDGTTVLGALTFTALVAGCFAIGQAKGALFLLPLFFAGTRFDFAPSTQESRRLLLRFASTLRISGDATSMAFAWETADDGAERIRISLPSARAGLVDVSFGVASASIGILRRRSVMLLVHTRAQSDADDVMRRRNCGTEGVRAIDGTVVRLVPWNEAAIELLRVLGQPTPKPVKASRGTWLLRELAAPDRRAA